MTFVYFTMKDEFPNATGRTIWSCGEYFFLVSSIVNDEMAAAETMVFQCNSLERRPTEAKIWPSVPIPIRKLKWSKNLSNQAFGTLHEENLRAAVEHFVRYEATTDQLASIKQMFTPSVFD